jgi:malate permease and related proteins
MIVILTALSKVLPIFLLILLGILLRRMQFISWGTIGDITKLVVNVTLPAVLFLAFAQVTVEPQYLLIVLIMFMTSTLVLVLGRYLGSPLYRSLSEMPTPPILTTS